ncbi:MAG: RluA family pseudouridine synthase [Ferruginibacter sp.]
MAKNNLEIIFENDDLVVVNKPSGMLTISDRAQNISLKEILLQKYGKIFTVHRLDRDTSGTVLFAKNEEAHRYFSLLFENRKVEKFYLGIVVGNPADDEGTIDSPIAEHPFIKGKMIINKHGKESLTTYKVMEHHNFFSLVEFQLHTGRTHQIRIHSKNIGHPIACDPLYGEGEPIKLSSIKKKYKLSKLEEEERPIITRLALHSNKLIIDLPDGEKKTFIAPMPKDFMALMKQQSKLKV